MDGALDRLRLMVLQLLDSLTPQLVQQGGGRKNEAANFRRQPEQFVGSVSQSAELLLERFFRKPPILCGDQNGC